MKNGNGCQCCGRELTDEISKARKIGPKCWAGYQTGIAAAGTSMERVAALENADSSHIDTWLRVAKKAIGQGKLKFARFCFEAADRRAALEGVKLPALQASWCEEHWSSDCSDAVAV